jgi:hypothetical protein
LFWQQVEVANGLMPAGLQTPGLAVTLQPRRPTTAWTSTAYVTGSGGSLAAPTPGAIPPVARLDDYAHASALVSGPLKGDRLGLVAGATWSQSSKFVRELMPASDSDLASGFVHLVFAPSAMAEWRTLGWVQSTSVPSEYRRILPSGTSTSDDSWHVQSTYERRTPSGLNWRVLGGVTQRARAYDTNAVSSLTVDRLLDGPVPAIVAATGDSTATRWSAGARIAPAAISRGSVQHATEIGADVDRGLVTTDDQFVGTIGELVDTTPARMWTFTNPGIRSHRQATTVSAYASDHIVFSSRVTLDASLRFETVAGSADSSTDDIRWYSWLPNAYLRWQFADRGRMTLVGGYRRSANQLNLDLLTYGDPAAPTGVVRRWFGGPAPSSAVIDRVGPGTAGDPAFSRINTDLKRPVTDEYVVGIESRHGNAVKLSLIGVARRETNLVNVVDVGVPISSYSTIGIPDAGVDFFSDGDDQILAIYNRLPASFGRNEYILTNPGQDAAVAYGLKFTAEGSTDRLYLLFGATAALAEGSGASRGYRPDENDQDVPGELFTNPNAATHARGRLFADRAFTIKWTTAYRFPWDIRAAAVARYQDGQPSARLVIAPDLNQGAEAVRAFPNGRNRFTYTGTLDLRFQKGFTMGRTRLDAIVDVYNLATRSNEVDEYVVTGPDFRTPTAIEPQRSVHAGLRVTF